MSDIERKCLKALIDLLKDSAPGFYTCFSPICKKTGLSRKVVRRAIRSLDRKGFTEYARGLCDEDGEFRGAGYRPTEKAFESLKQREMK